MQQIDIIPYSEARKDMHIGDIIGCRGAGFVSRAIIWAKGGMWSWSHVSTIIRDIESEGTGRVSVLEAIGGGGMQRNYLSKAYEADHGTLFWLPMSCDTVEKYRIKELGAQCIEEQIKYDFRSTWLAMFKPIFVDAEKFNCSENAWWLLTRAGRLMKRYDKKGREIAPVPGDFPLWSGVTPFQLDMSC